MDVMGLIFRVDGQLEVEAVVDVDVSENTSYCKFDNLLALDIELNTFRVQQVGDEPDCVREDVNIDVRALADVSGHDTADEPGTKGAEEPHQPQRFKAHLAEVLGAFVPFVDTGMHL